MVRISRDEMLMEMAYVAAQRGTCSRLRVGAVISKNGRIITMGYNGAPSDIDHCDHSSEMPPKVGMYDGILDNIDWEIKPGKLMEMTNDMSSAVGCKIAEHAERNAIAFAARYGQALDGSELHCTHAPCLDCSRSIINAGIRRVSYHIPYRRTEGVELLSQAGIEVVWADANV